MITLSASAPADILGTEFDDRHSLHQIPTAIADAEHDRPKATQCGGKSSDAGHGGLAASGRLRPVRAGLCRTDRVRGLPYGRR